MGIETQIVIALALDLAIGDPKRFPHPVRLLGAFALHMESLLRPKFHNPKTAGIVCVVIVVLVSMMAASLIVSFFAAVSSILGSLVSIILIYLGIAARDMVDHSSAVYNELKTGSIEGARSEVAMICGRDADNLSDTEVVKATVESVGENSVDGAIAPILFAFIGGPVGLWGYKAVSTLDSMFGYKNEKYLQFGWASAKLDDILNFIPARIAGLMIVMSTGLVGGNSRQSYRIFMRDRKKHTSPNSAHGEAAMAGAIGIQLGGPSSYGGMVSDKPLIGDSLTNPIPEHILLANALLILSVILTTAIMVVII